jgi:hypothetical protein
MFFLGVDSGVKSLSISHIEIRIDIEKIIATKAKLMSVVKQLDKLTGNPNKNTNTKLNHITNTLKEILELTDQCNKLLDIKNIVIIHSIKVYDLCPGKKVKSTSQQERLLALKNILTKYDNKPINHVCIEYQMSKSDKSRVVSNVIFYHFLGRPNCEVHSVNARLKNNISYGGKNIHDFATQIGRNGKTVSKYSANKKHCKDMFEKFMKNTKNEKTLKKLPKPFIKDAADSFWTVIAFFGAKLAVRQTRSKQTRSKQTI